MNHLKNSLFVALSLFAINAHAADVDITWQNATTRVDGSELPQSELATTEIKWSCETGDGSMSAPPDKQAVSVTIDKMGLCSFQARHVDIVGTQSAWSDPFEITLPADSAPSKPIIIEITIRIN